MLNGALGGMVANLLLGSDHTLALFVIFTAINGYSPGNGLGASVMIG
jgi:hypothetical protein